MRTRSALVSVLAALVVVAAIGFGWAALRPASGGPAVGPAPISVPAPTSTSPPGSTSPPAALTSEVPAPATPGPTDVVPPPPVDDDGDDEGPDDVDDDGED